jgi:hypothetical protein
VRLPEPAEAGRSGRRQSRIVMELLFAALSGVIVGALVTASAMLLLLQRRSDRDLIERRLRACFDYRECLGDIEGAFSGSNGDALVVEQAWHNVAALAREFRRTSWLFRPELRLRLAAVVEELERGRLARSSNGVGSGGRAAQLLCEKCRELDQILTREVEVEARKHVRWRLPTGAAASPQRKGEP